MGTQCSDYRDFYNFNIPQDYGIEINMYAPTTTYYAMTLYDSWVVTLTHVTTVIRMT